MVQQEDQLQLGVCNTLQLISIPAIDQCSSTPLCEPEALCMSSLSKPN